MNLSRIGFWLIVIGAILCFVGVAYPVDISQPDRVPNRTGSQCVWSSLETLARHHKLTRLHDHLTREHFGVAGPGGPEYILNRYGVRYYSQPQGNRDRRILDYACKHDLGAAIGLHGRHMVTLVGLEGNCARIIDNSDPSLSVHHIGLDAWDGWAIVLLPDGYSDPSICQRHGFS